MRRFIYAPEVTAYIRSDEANAIIDVSKDIVSGEITRRLDAVSNATLTLQNKFGLYTRKFKPMDRIAIFMRRIGDPMLVFTGYVDEAPFYQMFPAPVTIQASCPLKLLQNTYFDPGLPFMTQWFKKFHWLYDPSSGSITAPMGGFGNYDSPNPNAAFSEGNMERLITAALTEIAGWPRDHIFIRSIPKDFIKTMHYLMEAEAMEYKEDYAHMLNTMQAILGIGTSEDPTAGSADLPTFTGGNASAVQIAAFAKNAGFKGDALVTAVAVALAESSGVSDAMNYNSSSGTYDVGIWQINTVHTAGGTGLAAPPGGNGTLNMPGDYNAVKSSLPAGVQTFISNCKNPTFNAKQAYTISSKGQSFQPWSTYPSASASHMAEARKAVDALLHRNGNTTASTDPTSDRNNQMTQWADTSTSDNGGKGKTVAKFITYCKQYLGTPYRLGGRDPKHGGADCSGFVYYVFLHYWGITLLPPTYSQVNKGEHVDKADLRPGDLAFFYPDENGVPGPGHVGIYIGNGNVIHDPHTGSVVQIVPLDSMPFVEGRRVLNGNVPMGNIDNSANTATGAAVQDQASTAAQARAAAWFQTQLPSVDPITSEALSGKRALANDIPLFEWIQQMCKGSGRRFTTMPNGDFLAFFPDYFNDFNRTPYFLIRPIEIIDLNIQVSDRSLYTHVFATGTSYTPQISLLDRMLSMVASVQEPAFNMFINVDDQKTKNVKQRKGKKKSKKKTTTKLNTWAGANKFLKRYGARPLPVDLPDLRNPVLLWMAAWMEFQKNWSQQFGATASFTFMPEILPGGIVNLDNKISMFVESVTHTWDLEQGYSTSAELTSPAAVNKKDKRFGSMVLAGGNFGVAQSLKDDKSIAKDAGPPGSGDY